MRKLQSIMCNSCATVIIIIVITSCQCARLSMTTLATMRCQTTLSSEALMSCVGLTLSFHDAHKLSIYFSLTRPSLSSPLYFQSPPDFQGHAFALRDPGKQIAIDEISTLVYTVSLLQSSGVFRYYPAPNFFDT